MVEDNLVDSAGCRRVEGIVVDDIDVTTELEPRDRLEQRYAVVGHESAFEGACPPTGTYRIENQYGDVGTWGFEIALD